jgi:hypothetical protein
MPEFVFGQPETRRIVSSVRWSEAERRRLRERARAPAFPPAIASFINIAGTGNTAPAHAIMSVAADGLDAGEKLHSTQQPDSALRELYVVNGFEAVENAQTGECFLPGQVVHVAYDTGTPGFGETWGPKPGQWTASRDGVPMFRVLSIVDETAKIMRAWFEMPRWILSRIGGSWSAESSASGLPVYGGPPGAETDTGMDVVAQNRGPQITVSGGQLWIGLEWNGEGWYADHRDTDDIKVKASVNDSTAGFLGAKLDASADQHIGMTLNNPGGNEFYNLSHDGPVTGETAITLGTESEKVSGTPDSTSLDLTATALAGELWVLCASHQPVDGDDFTLYPRLIHWDGKGHLATVSGEASGITITITPGGADTDEKVAVVNGQPAGYLSQVITNWQGAATFDPNKDIPIYAEQDGDNALFYFPFTTLPGYNSATAGQVIGHESDGTVACIVFVGDGQWISVAYTASTNSWDFSHGNPKNEAANIVTLGASPPSTSTSADSNTFTANGTNSLEIWLPSRVVFDATNLRFVYTLRKWKRDSKGHGYSVVAETGPHTIFDFKAVTGYSGSATQAFIHEAGTLKWLTGGTCTT